MDNSRYESYLSKETDSTSLFAAKLADVKEKLGLRQIPTLALLPLVALLVGGLVFAAGNYLSGKKAQPTGTSTTVTANDDEGTADDRDVMDSSDASVFVYVTGAVQKPGVYELEQGARGIDAINAAGGLLDNAAPETLNLAAVLEDATQLHVLTKKEAKELGSGGVMPSGSPSASGAQQATGQINLNSADSATLQTLPGIGPVTADKIVADREKNGPYASLGDLMRVAGIGPKKVEALEGLVTVSP